MKLINSFFVKSSILLLAIGILASCAASAGVRIGHPEPGDKVQNNTDNNNKNVKQ